MPVVYPYLKKPRKTVAQIVSGCSDGLDYFMDRKNNILGAQPTDLANTELAAEIFKKTAAELSEMYAAIPTRSLSPKI